MFRAIAASAVLFAVAARVGSAAEAKKPDLPPEGLRPVVVGTEDARPREPAEKAKPAKPPDPIRVDEATHTVRLPVRFSRTSGVAERFLSAGNEHGPISLLVTDHSAKAVAEAFAKAGWPAGRPPAADGHVRPPEGPTVEMDVVVKRHEGAEVHYPVNLFLSTKPKGKPTEEGKWVYAGPQVAREGGDEILVTAISGSLVTLNMRDTSAMIHWVPDVRDELGRLVRTFYISGVPMPPEGFACELEFRPAAPAAPAKEEKAAGPPAEPGP